MHICDVTVKMVKIDSVSYIYTYAVYTILKVHYQLSRILSLFTMLPKLPQSHYCTIAHFYAYLLILTDLFLTVCSFMYTNVNQCKPKSNSLLCCALTFSFLCVIFLSVS